MEGKTVRPPTVVVSAGWQSRVQARIGSESRREADRNQPGGDPARFGSVFYHQLFTM